MMSIESRKRLDAHLKNARAHTQRACRFRDPRHAAAEIHAALGNLSCVIDEIVHVLSARLEMFARRKRGTDE